MAESRQKQKINGNSKKKITEKCCAKNTLRHMRAWYAGRKPDTIEKRICELESR